MSTEISVEGEHRVFEQPERAVASVVVGLEGPAPAPVYDALVASFATVRASLEPLTDEHRGPVVRWDAQQIRTWANRPWSQDGTQLPLVHYAQVGVQVEFSDFTALSEWIGTHASTVGFSAGHIDWRLTREREADVLRAVRAEAVREAARRAQEYADALDLGQVRPVAIADVGLPPGYAEVAPAAAMMRSAKFADDGAADAIDLSPQELELSARVTARFVTG